MRNIMLCIIFCSFALGSIAQLKVKHSQPHIPMNSEGLAYNEQHIGNTWWDRQSNRMLSNRIYLHMDGTIGIVWTMGFDQPPDFPDRGTGYNYYDGSGWGPIPQQRIESFRAGWPSYAPLGTEGEIVVCHEFEAKKLCTVTRPLKGSGDWTETFYNYSSGPPLLACPRMITAGADHNSIHLLAWTYDPYMGQEAAMVYSRSQDGGATWNIENVVLEGTGADYYTAIWQDNYVWADERNGTIAFLCANILWHDMFMMKSTDDGDSWEKTIIWEHPYPFYNSNTTTDTFFCVDGSADIALDPDGMAHVVFGISKIWKPDLVYLDPYCDGIGYWNENMAAFSNDPHALAPPGYGYANSEMVEDYNYIGWMQDINGNGTIDLNTDIFFYPETFGASTMPTIMVSAENEIFVLFSSTTETYEYETYNYKHIWARSFCFGEWHDFVHLTLDISHIYDECIYPVLASSSDDNIHYIYHTDATPGLAVAYGSHGYQNNRIIYGSAPKDGICMTGIRENNKNIINSKLIVEISPNPFSTSTTLIYTLDKPENLQFTVYNVQSQIVYSLQEKQEKGKHQLQWNAEGLPAGLYCFRMQAGDKVGGGKMVKME